MNVKSIPLIVFTCGIVVLCMSFCMRTAHASTGNNAVVSMNNSSISIKADNISLSNLLESIQDKSNLKVELEQEIKDTISIDISNMPVEEALKRVLKDYDYAMIWKLRNDKPVLTALRIIGKGGEKDGKKSDLSPLEGKTVIRSITNGREPRETGMQGEGEPTNQISLISDIAESTVKVAIENARDMGAYEFRFTYDPKTVQIENITSDAFLSNTGRNVSFLGPKINNKKGEALFGAFSFGDNKGAEGGGILAKVKYSGKSSSIPIRLKKVKLFDKNGKKLDFRDFN